MKFTKYGAKQTSREVTQIDLSEYKELGGFVVKRLGASTQDSKAVKVGRQTDKVTEGVQSCLT